jgi:hypothetical protein
MKYVYQHLGLGDHIVCNGLVRILANQYGKITLFCKTHNFETVSFMFRDNPNITILPFKDDSQVHQYVKNNNLYSDVVKIGHENLGRYMSTCNFDEAFYKQFNVNFENRWSSFYVQRDFEREKILFDKFNVIKNEYIFIHDDDRFRVNENKIKSSLPIIRVNRELTPIIFDYISLMENALEVHAIESSFQFVNDSLSLNNNTYVHRYARTLPQFELPKYKNVKEILI